MRYVVLAADSRVVNVVEVAQGAEWSAPAGCTLLASDIGDIGDRFDGAAFVPPASARTPPLRRLVRRSVIVDRLQAIGKLEAARAALDAADLYSRERWNARAAVYADDPTAIALLRAIGADPDAILAP
jgi:hypothetical protein